MYVRVSTQLRTGATKLKRFQLNYLYILNNQHREYTIQHPAHTEYWILSYYYVIYWKYKFCRILPFFALYFFYSFPSDSINIKWNFNQMKLIAVCSFFRRSDYYQIWKKIKWNPEHLCLRVYLCVHDEYKYENNRIQIKILTKIRWFQEPTRKDKKRPECVSL